MIENDNKWLRLTLLTSIFGHWSPRNGRGAMVSELGKERYPGDPQGRAAKQGVREGYAVPWHHKTLPIKPFRCYLNTWGEEDQWKRRLRMALQWALVRIYPTAGVGHPGFTEWQDLGQLQWLAVAMPLRLVTFLIPGPGKSRGPLRKSHVDSF